MAIITDTITLGASSVNVGVNLSYTITNKNSEITVHTITYSVGSFSGTIISQAGQTSVGGTYTATFSLPGTVLPSSMSGTVTLTMTTIGVISGNTAQTTKTYTLVVPAYSINSAHVTKALTFTDLKINNQYFLNAVSRCTMRVDYSQKSNYGVYPYVRFYVYNSSNSLLWQGTYSINSSGYASTWVFNFPSDVNQNLYVKFYMYDSRGKSYGSSGSPISIGSYYNYPYSAPSITAEIVRCDSDGTINPGGDYIKVNGTATVSNINNENIGTSTTVYDSTTMGTQSFTGTSAAVSLTPYITSKSSSGTGSISVTDTVGNTTTVNLTYSNPFVLMAINENSIGFGSIPAANRVDINIDPKFHPIITSGQANLFSNWTTSYNTLYNYCYQYRIGNIVMVFFSVKWTVTSNSVPAGKNLMTATWLGERPPKDVEFCSYWGHSKCVARISPTGAFTLRHVGYGNQSFINNNTWMGGMFQLNSR